MKPTNTPWSDHEVLQLVELRNSGMTWSEVSEQLGRTYESVRSMHRRLVDHKVGKTSPDRIASRTVPIKHVLLESPYPIYDNPLEMEGDAVIINGPVADHGLSILSCRREFDFQTDIVSDCAPLSMLVSDIKKKSKNVHALRDATRGGLATVLCEIAGSILRDIEIYEGNIPVREQARGICEFLGMDFLS